MKSLLSLFLVFCLLFSLPALCESTEDEEYQSMLAAAQLMKGSNQRIKNVLERAKNGENITLAVIGGSITEGAGAKSYSECWARRLLDALRAEYGCGDGTNIGLVNAGVGGTASTFGWMRYQRDVVDRVKDDDGLPDIVIIEYAVNDSGEPTRHGCYESMVRSVLKAENAPAVILLFSVFPGGFTLQNDLAPIGLRYGLTMVSIRDSAYPLVGSRWTEKEFFYDQYHPTSLGHQVMADCIMAAIRSDMARDTDPSDVTADPVRPVYSVNYMGMRSVFGDSIPDDIGFSAGGFASDDTASYSNLPVGRVCGKNFSHSQLDPNEPLTFTACFKNLLLSYRTVSSGNFGSADVFIDGERVMTLNAVQSGAWGQSDTKLIYVGTPSETHQVEIRMAPGSENKRFTVTGISFTP